MLISHQSGSQVVPILLTVYLFQPSTGGKVQMKEKVQTNSRPRTACFACSRMLPRGRQITKNRSKDRTASDHRATIPEANSRGSACRRSVGRQQSETHTTKSWSLFLITMKITAFFPLSPECEISVVSLYQRFWNLSNWDIAWKTRPSIL